jgi:hypothetical protein
MSADLHERLVQLAGTDLGEPDLIAGWRRGQRLRRLQRLRRAAMAALCSGVLVGLTLWLIGTASTSPSVTVNPAVSGRFSDPVHGFSITLPDGWHRAQQPLVASIDPQELLSVGTYPLPANTAGPACDAQLPKTDLDHLRPSDLYLLVIENHFSVTPTSTAPIDPARYPARPRNFANAHFHTGACTGPTWSYPDIKFEQLFFRDRGRVIGVYLASGRAVTPQRQAQAWQLLNSLRLTPNTPLPKGISGTRQTIISAPVPDDIASIFQRGTIIEGRPLVPDTTADAFSVNLNSVFVTADIDTTTVPGGTPPPQPPRACTFSKGTLPQGGQGLGLVSGPCVPLTDVASGSRAAVFVIADFPKPSQYTWAWTHLPAGTAFVTFTAGPTQLWERPVAAVAAFLQAFQGSNPVLRAYDTHGRVLAEVTAPRFAGDPITPVGGIEHPR